MDEIQKLGKEVKDEIALAKAHADRQDQELQEKERVAQSRQRSRVKKFIPKAEKELETIKELQLQQSTRQLSQYFPSHEKGGCLLVCRRGKAATSGIFIFT